MSTRAVGLWVLCCLVALCSCGAPPLEPNAGAGQDRCASDDLAGCENALLTASGEAVADLVDSYSRARNDESWSKVWEALRSGKGALWIGDAAPSSMQRVALPAPPVAIDGDALLLALGKAAGRPHVLVSRADEMVQLFPVDVLAPHLLELPAMITTDRALVDDDTRVAATVRAAISAAQSFDYVAAATQADRLFAMVASRPHDDEAAMRARRAIALLDNAGIALVQRTDDERDNSDADEAVDFGDRSTAYADLLAVLAAKPDSQAEWTRRRARITAGMSADRVRLLTHLYGDDEPCAPPQPPPMDSRGDLLFASLVPASLDTQAAPGDVPTAGKLGVEQWLPRYQRMVELVAESNSTWSLAANMLAQRGQIHGLSAAGTATYRKVAALAASHVDGLNRLAVGHPGRFQTLGVVALVYQSGVLGDARLRQKITQLVQHSVALKIEAATEVSSLYEAALAAFAVGMSYPAPLQGPHFSALRQGLANKLAGPFGAQGGWGLAGIQLGGAVLGMLMGQQRAIGAAAPRIAQALAAANIAYPTLAKLVTSAARYAELGEGADATVSNPAMFSKARSEARSALRSAVENLAEGGPQTPPQRALLGHSVDLADGLIVALIAHISDGDDSPQCAGDSAVGAKSKLRDSYDRLQKKRRALIEQPAFSGRRDDNTWAQRVRLLALVLSDILDLADQKGGNLRFRIADEEAQRIVEAAVGGWAEGEWSDVARSGYLLARSAFGQQRSDPQQVMANAIRVLRALAGLFGNEDASIFASLAQVGSATDAAKPEAGDLASMLERHARRAYAASAHDEGDLLLMIALSAAIVQDESVPADVIELARARERPVYLPLLLHGEKAKRGGDPANIGSAIRAAIKGSCDVLDAATVIAMRHAIHDFRRGERDKALSSIERQLDAAAKRGLTIPRQIFRYEQRQAGKAFNAEQSISMGGHLLKGSGSLQLGLGMQSNQQSGASMTMRFGSATNAASFEEAARYYAHASTIAAVYHFAEGNQPRAIAHARRAVATWTNGVRLGKVRVPTGPGGGSWTRDASGVLVIAAQQAADAGHAFLAGDLWTLARTSFDDGASDDTIAETLDPLPLPLRGIPEVEDIKKSAAKSLELVAAKLSCTTLNGDPAALGRTGCRTYPQALGLRIADAMPVLPRLKSSSERGNPVCGAWRVVDKFLSAADEGLYQPEYFTDAISALTTQGRVDDAAALLTRHRHSRHCSPVIVAQARDLATHRELGVHLRADLLTISANCKAGAGGGDIAGELSALDDLTQRHALPSRNFEVLLFATRHALVSKDYQPLYAMSQKPRFIQRWHELGPDLAAAALLIHHASAIGSDEALDKEGTLPFYRLVCLTFPVERLGATCNTISLLRGGGPSADKKTAAADALASFVQRTTSSAPSQP